MSTSSQCLNDEPIGKKAEDKLGWPSLIAQMVSGSLDCKPPYVFGIHGDWGAGKTSLLNLFQAELKSPAYRDSVVPVFFEAWKYQYEPAPIVALLHEIRQQITWNDHFVKKLSGEVKKLGEVSIRSALLGFEDITKKIGIQASKIQQTGEEWEKRHHATAIPSDVIRNLLDNTIKTLIGKNNKKQRRLVVIIDDLDRCHHETAFQLLEGIKIYLNIESCVFFLGINQQEIQRAVATNLNNEGDRNAEELEVRSREYIEKLCAYIWPLPIIGRQNELDLTSHWIKGPGQAKVIELIEKFSPCLPANPRRIKAFCNTVNRILTLSKASGKQPESCDDAAAVVIAAYFQTYHPTISRILQREHGFYHKIRDWVETPDLEKFLETYPPLRSLKLRYTPAKVEGDAPTDKPAKLDSLFLDPAYGNSLHIQQIIFQNQIESELVSRFLSY